MTSEAVNTRKFRGVLCRHCGKAIRVPGLVMRHESAAHDYVGGDNDSTFHLISRVFVLRCRSCEKESVYAINQIEEFTITPPPPKAEFKTAAA